MASYIIEGTPQIKGEINLHGAKNAALPILSACLLAKEASLHNCPKLSDVNAACDILSHLGCNITWQNNTLIIRSDAINSNQIPDNLMREMRSSIIFLGAIIAKCKSARLSYPGGCELGSRPIDMHLNALKKLGVVVKEDHGFLDCTAPNGLKGATITLPFPSVGATENTMIAACACKGETVIYNAAREPEILDLAAFLNSLGYKIRVRIDGSIVIKGCDNPDGVAEHTVIPDRIACTTYLCMAAAAGGEILISDTKANHLSAILPTFEEMGCKIKCYNDKIFLKRDEDLKNVRIVRTMPYPGFPTDAQSPLMAVTTLASGTSVFVENIFESRYKHVAELIRMGANIKVEGKVAIVEGVKKLHGASVISTDLRGGAALCVAAVAAEGRTTVSEIKHILRGYDNFDYNLTQLGVNIKRE